LPLKNYEASEKMRKIPTQVRSEATVETILEAAAQIIERDEARHFTTNHVAERAGYSIGTLYGYFPNKQSLLKALAVREMKKRETALLALLASVGPDQSFEDITRLMVRAAIRPFGKRNMLRVRLFQILIKDPDIKDAIISVQDHVFDVFLTALSQRSGAVYTLSRNARFTLFAAISGAVQTTLEHYPDYVETASFEDDLVTLIVSYIRRT
jgi:AcrR family transcriptional regulator